MFYAKILYKILYKIYLNQQSLTRFYCSSKRRKNHRQMFSKTTKRQQTPENYARYYLLKHVYKKRYKCD
ncbi:hypothetical protein HMPREF1575_01355 [Gardnerella vaginalis JCP7672]|nr:hypothetical protein HMPREF1575_01355 [Gardnerella vaginalis JCP7672]